MRYREEAERPLDSIVHHPQCTVKHAHEVTRGIAALGHKLLAFGAHRDQELVDTHGPAGAQFIIFGGDSR